MVTALYAGLIALLYLFLSYNVVLARRSQRVSVGDGGDKLVRKRMRTHANCAEYAPIGLILLMLVEMQGMPLWLVHVFGLILLAGRLSHAYGFGSTPQIVPLRKLGMYLTLLMIICTAVANIGYAIL
ncbi:MAG: MAPEG family protein [Alterinioella nitratireducens]|uniref:MAPEG family protein n=1 Tax=Alterinioella nitratireducens TaxID=2735915 RepID=UPI0040587DC9|tara:strand:+ start:35 stop:415 length:381 start_codon:yes stop_codon:yes gene_type:complete